jgi:cell wall-associated NlpC family hydrolase
MATPVAPAPAPAPRRLALVRLLLPTILVLGAVAWLAFLRGGAHQARATGQRVAAPAPSAAGRAATPAPPVTTALRGTAAAGVAHIPGARPVPGAGGAIAEVPDPETARSFPDAAAAAAHTPAATPAQAVSAIAPGAPSDAEVAQELLQLKAIQHSQTSIPHAGTVALDGQAVPPPGAPAAVDEIVAGGNAIADFPYVYGGGHASFVDTGYDCSGSVSYALAAAGLLRQTEVSGQLESWGVAGPGRWLTVFANAGHTYLEVAGLWFDTVGRAGPLSTRWSETPHDSPAGFVIRHWPGL